MRRIHLLLAGQSLIIVLLSINRLSSATLGYVASTRSGEGVGERG